MIIATFQILDKLGFLPFFQKIFLLGDISIEVGLGIFFELLVILIFNLLK